MDTGTLKRIVALAHEFDVQVAPNDDGDDVDDDDQDHYLEARRSSPVATELHELIEGLNEDEALDVVVLVWIGRGTYSVDEWADARETAILEHVGPTSDYLMGTPLLADYLEAGLDAVNVAAEKV